MKGNMNIKRNPKFDSTEINKSLNKKEEEEKINSISNVNSNYDRKLNIFKLINSEEPKEDEDEIDKIFDSNKYNNIISYYYTTAKYLKNSNEYCNIKSLILNSKNYIPKNNNHYKYQNNCNENYINNFNKINSYLFEMNNKMLYDLLINNPEQEVYNNCYTKQYNNQFINNYLLSQRLFIGNNTTNNNIYNNAINPNESCEKNISNGLFELSESTITNINSQNNVINNINCPPFVPSNYNEKEGNIFITRSNTNDSSLKDKETDSTSSISEKKEEEEEEENNYDSFNHFEKSKMLEQNLEKSEYLVEMFGRKGWICILCNNFNYETRTKCNRCGEVKKPKKIVDLRTKYEPKEYKEIKERSNKKGDWVCMNCKNLNYSFRTACNRCKIPKVNPYLNTQAFKREIAKMQNYSKYSFSPSFVIFNNMNNVYKNNVDKYKK